MTETTTRTANPDVRPGAIVIVRDGDHRRLAMVSAVADGTGAVVVATLNPDTEEISTCWAVPGQLEAPPDRVDAESWALMRRIAAHVTAQAMERGAELTDSCERLNQRLTEANRTIASMRSYAINKHVDGSICREGLNDFLHAHGLEEYVPQHTANVTVTAQVGIENAHNDHDARNLIEQNLELTSDDEDVRVISIDTFDVREVELVLDDD